MQGEVNGGFNSSVINVEEEHCCDGQKDTKMLVKKCGCEEVGELCGCRLEKVQVEEKRQQVVFESWDKWKCMLLLIVVMGIVTWIVIFTSLTVKGYL
ncbi:hypothetical protein CHUAL_012663 [Chamberlinius hualienensis]